MDKLYIGITGPMLSGKGTAAEFFRDKFNVQVLGYSRDILNSILSVLDLDFTRKNQQDLGELLRKEFGEDVMSVALFERAKNSHSPVIVFEGIRKKTEADLFRKLGNFKLLYIDSNNEKRFERLKGRNERVGENTQTFEQFNESQQHDAENEIEALKNHADFIIQNNGTIQDFQGQLTRVMTESL